MEEYMSRDAHFKILAYTFAQSYTKDNRLDIMHRNKEKRPADPHYIANSINVKHKSKFPPDIIHYKPQLAKNSKIQLHSKRAV